MARNEVQLHVKTWMDLTNMLNERSHIHYHVLYLCKIQKQAKLFCYKTEQLCFQGEERDTRKFLVIFSFLELGANNILSSLCENIKVQICDLCCVFVNDNSQNLCVNCAKFCVNANFQ